MYTEAKLWTNITSVCNKLNKATYLCSLLCQFISHKYYIQEFLLNLDKLNREGKHKTAL